MLALGGVLFLKSEVPLYSRRLGGGAGAVAFERAPQLASSPLLTSLRIFFITLKSRVE